MSKQLYKRESYLKKIRPFIDDEGIIKVVTGIRRCGKSCLMETVAQELAERGVPDERIVYLDLEKHGLRNVKTPDRLEEEIEKRLPATPDGTVYLFIDEVQRVEGFEEVVNGYRADGGFSVFVTGSNSYLLSGELMTNLTGRYIELLVNAKVLYRCDRFDMKSKKSLQGGEKYYLADTGIYFARNVNATMDYGPLLENAVFTFLKSKDYRVSVGSVGDLEVDFVARRPDEGYAYIQVSMTVADKSVEEREYRPFSKVRDNFPQYLLSLDPLPLERDGVTHRNLIELLGGDDDL